MTQEETKMVNCIAAWAIIATLGLIVVIFSLQV